MFKESYEAVAVLEIEVVSSLSPWLEDYIGLQYWLADICGRRASITFTKTP